MTNRVKILKQKFSQSWGLPFKELLPESAIDQAINELKIKYRRRLFDPIVTLWAFLSQVLDVDKSCHKYCVINNCQTVNRDNPCSTTDPTTHGLTIISDNLLSATSRVISYLVGESQEIPSTDTSAYCQARSRLPEKLLEKLFDKAAQSLSEKVTIEHLWSGRNVLVIDGSTVSMPDTVENQKAYPQPSSQKPGCGFPIAKIGVLFSLATGAAIALAIDVLNTHDLTLARKLYKFLKPNDILLGDRAFCAYADLIAIKILGCDALFRKHQSRKTTMRKGKIVGDCDKFVTWPKPKKYPKGLSEPEFLTLPSTLTVREIYYYIIIPGFRTQRVSLITTLLDTRVYPTLEVLKLYGERWNVELNLKHLKTTLGMEVLRCKTP